MKLKEIFNLINEKSFHKAKQELILLKKSENSYDDINFTIAQAKKTTLYLTQINGKNMKY